MALAGIFPFGITNSLAPPAVRPKPVNPGLVRKTGEAIPEGVGMSITARTGVTEELQKNCAKKDLAKKNWKKELGSRLRFCDFSLIFLLNEIFCISEFSVGLKFLPSSVVSAANVGGVEARDQRKFCGARTLLSPDQYQNRRIAGVSPVLSSELIYR